MGWTAVGPASRKAAAIALAQSESFDAALLDINLNCEMSWDIALALRERGIPFVFSTGYDVGIAMPADLAGSPVIGKLSSEGEIEQQLRRVVAVSRTAAMV